MLIFILALVCSKMPKNKVSRKWLPTKRIARSLHDIDSWLYKDLICPLCLQNEHKWRHFDDAQTIISHCVERHLSKLEQFLLYAFLNYSDKKASDSDDVQIAIDQVLEDYGKRDIRSSQCFCPFCLASLQSVCELALFPHSFFKDPFED